MIKILFILFSFLLWRAAKSIKWADILAILKNKASPIVVPARTIAGKYMPDKLRAVVLWLRADKTRAYTVFWLTATVCFYSVGRVQHVLDEFGVTGRMNIDEFIGHIISRLHLAQFPWIIKVFHVAGFIWFVITVIMVLCGGENYCLTFGGVAIAFSMCNILKMSEPLIKKRLPEMAEYVFIQIGGPYFVCAAFTLTMTVGALVCKMQLLAEQLATIAFYCLVIGVVKDGTFHKQRE